MGSVTNKQIKKIWALSRELDMDEDLLRAVVHGVTGSTSISNMDSTEAAEVIDSLMKHKGKMKPTENPGRASQKQIWKMKFLAKELGWEDNPKRLKGFIKKYAGVDRLEWLTAAQAWKVIEGLKALAERVRQEEKEG